MKIAPKNLFFITIITCLLQQPLQCMLAPIEQATPSMALQPYEITCSDNQIILLDRSLVHYSLVLEAMFEGKGSQCKESLTGKATSQFTGNQMQFIVDSLLSMQNKDTKSLDLLVKTQKGWVNNECILPMVKPFDYYFPLANHEDLFFKNFYFIVFYALKCLSPDYDLENLTTDVIPDTFGEKLKHHYSINRDLQTLYLLHGNPMYQWIFTRLADEIDLKEMVTHNDKIKWADEKTISRLYYPEVKVTGSLNAHLEGIPIGRIAINYDTEQIFTATWSYKKVYVWTLTYLVGNNEIAKQIALLSRISRRFCYLDDKEKEKLRSEIAAFFSPEIQVYLNERYDLDLA